jgi:hypothetical protein
LANKCGDDATRKMAAQKPAGVDLLSAKLSPNLAFQKT